MSDSGWQDINLADTPSVIKQLYPNAQITSAERSPDDPLSRANPHSWHIGSNAATDIAPIPGMSFDQYLDGFRKAGYNIIQAADEATHPMPWTTGPNWHVVLAHGPNTQSTQPTQEAQAAPTTDAPDGWKDIDPTPTNQWRDLSPEEAIQAVPQTIEGYRQPGEGTVGVDDLHSQALIAGVEDMFQRGATPEQVLKTYPNLNPDEIKAAFAYRKQFPMNAFNWQIPTKDLPAPIQVSGDTTPKGDPLADIQSDAARGAAEGLWSYVTGAEGLGLTATDAVGLTKGAHDRFNQDQEDAAFDRQGKYYDPTGGPRVVGNLAGSVAPFIVGGEALSPVSQFAGGTSRAAKVVDAAIQGAGAGVVQSGGNDVLDQAIGGATIGAGLGSAAEGLGAVRGMKAPTAVEEAPVPTGNNPTLKGRISQKYTDTVAHVDNITKSWANKPNIKVVRTAKDITDPELRSQIEDNGASKDVRGAVGSDGTTWILASNHKNLDEVTATVFHEALGHKGLDGLFGQAKDSELVKLYEGNDNLKNEVDDWMVKNGHLVSDAPDPLARGIEEVLAEKSEAGQLNPGLLDRMKQMVRVFARRMGLNIKVSDNEVQTILGLAHRKIVNGGLLADPALSDSRFMYGGVKAKGDWAPGEMFTGPDDKSRFEFSDHESSLTPAFHSMTEEEPMFLDQVLHHPELFKQYPDAADINVTRKPGFMDLGRNMQGHFDSEKNNINITPYAADPHSTILHEIQHYIQEKEGFARGGNTGTALRSMTQEQLAKAANEAHFRWAKEVADFKKYEHDLQQVQPHAEEIKTLLDKGKTDEAENRLAQILHGVDSPNKLPFNDHVDLLNVRNAVRKGEIPRILGDIDNHLEKIQTRLEDLDVIDRFDPEDREPLIKLISKDSQTSFDAYRRLFGEVEARDVQRRRNLTDEQRQETPRYQPLPEPGNMHGWEPEEDNGWKFADTGEDTDHVKPEDYIISHGSGTSADTRFARRSTMPEKEKVNRTRIDKYFVSKDVKDILKEGAERITPGTTQKMSETRKLAKALQIDPSKISNITAEYAYAARQEIIKSARALKTLARRITNGENGDKLLQDFAHMMAYHVAVQQHVADIGTNAGRVLRMFRETVRSPTAGNARLSIKDGEVAGVLGSTKTIEEAAQVINGKSEEEIAGMTRNMMKPRWHDYLINYRLNNMLSGPNTLKHIHKSSAIALVSDYTTHVVAPKELLPRLVGMKEGFVNFWKKTVPVVDREENAVHDEEGKPVLESPFTNAWRTGGGLKNPLTIENRELPFKGPWRMFNYYQKVHGASAAFWQEIAHASEIRGLATRTAYNEGLEKDGNRWVQTHSPDQIEERTKELLINPTDDMLDMAKEKAAQITYIDRASAVTRLLNQKLHIGPNDPTEAVLTKVGLKMIVPIARVPDRTLAWALRWSPAGVLSKDFKAGGVRRNQAIARIVMGSAFYGWAAEKAWSGELTGQTVGSSPQDAANNEANGIKPHSIKINGVWHDYNGLGPLTIPLAMMAEAHTAATANNDEGMAEKAAHAIVGIGEAALDATWIKDITGLGQALDKHNREGIFQFLGQMGQSFVPFSAAQSQGQDIISGTMHDYKGDRSALDQIAGPAKNTIVGVRQTLPEAHDVYGRVIDKNGNDNSDPVYQELAKLKVPEKVLVGLPKRDKGESAEDYQADIQKSGSLIVSQVKQMMQSPEWKTMSDDDKRDVIKDIVKDARQQVRDERANPGWKYVS